MRFDKCHHKCISNDILIYPVYVEELKMFKIAVNVKGNEKLLNKPIYQKEINNALTKTYIHYANKFV